jgi:uncharacterized protein YqeY
MSIKEQLTNDLKAAMKSGDTQRRDVLRSLESMIKNEEIAQKKRVDGLADADVIAVLKRAVKQRKDSIAQFLSGGREDLATQEEEEVAIIGSYLPQSMSAEEVRRVVKKHIAAMDGSTPIVSGRVIGAVMQEIGDQTDGNTVREIVEELLS